METKREDLMKLVAAGLSHFNVKEAALYMGVSVAYIHKLTCERQIPYHKSLGRCVFFREDLDAFMRKDRVAPLSEITDGAQSYCAKSMR